MDVILMLIITLKGGKAKQRYSLLCGGKGESQKRKMSCPPGYRATRTTASSLNNQHGSLLLDLEKPKSSEGQLGDLSPIPAPCPTTCITYVTLRQLLLFLSYKIRVWLRRHANGVIKVRAGNGFMQSPSALAHRACRGGQRVSSS